MRCIISCYVTRAVTARSRAPAEEREAPISQGTRTELEALHCSCQRNPGSTEAGFSPCLFSLHWNNVGSVASAASEPLCPVWALGGWLVGRDGVMGRDTSPGLIPTFLIGTAQVIVENHQKKKKQGKKRPPGQCPSSWGRCKETLGPSRTIGLDVSPAKKPEKMFSAMDNSAVEVSPPGPPWPMPRRSPSRGFSSGLGDGGGLSSLGADPKTDSKTNQCL